MTPEKKHLSNNQIFIVGICVVLIGLLIIGSRIHRIVSELDTLHWLPVVANVDLVKCSVQEINKSSDKPYYIYQGKVGYIYRVNGVKFKGTQYDLGGFFTSGNKEKFIDFKRKLDDPSGLTVFYNYSDHSQSVIKRGISEDTWVRLGFSGFFLIVGSMLICKLGHNSNSSSQTN